MWSADIPDAPTTREWRLNPYRYISTQLGPKVKRKSFNKMREERRNINSTHPSRRGNAPAITPWQLRSDTKKPNPLVCLGVPPIPVWPGGGTPDTLDQKNPENKRAKGFQEMRARESAGQLERAQRSPGVPRRAVEAKRAQERPRERKSANESSRERRRAQQSPENLKVIFLSVPEPPL